LLVNFLSVVIDIVNVNVLETFIVDMSVTWISLELLDDELFWFTFIRLIDTSIKRFEIFQDIDLIGLGIN
jgi:hypothetical protein